MYVKYSYAFCLKMSFVTNYFLNYFIYILYRQLIDSIIYSKKHFQTKIFEYQNNNSNTGVSKKKIPPNILFHAVFYIYYTSVHNNNYTMSRLVLDENIEEVDIGTCHGYY